jgi:hypothetical protein
MKALFMFELIVVDNDIMEMYNNYFCVEPSSTEIGYFTYDEYLERHAENLAFWKRLRNDDKLPVNKVNNKHSTRTVYVIKKECEYRNKINETFKDKPFEIKRILMLADEINQHSLRTNIYSNI